MFGTIRRHQTWLWVIIASLTVVSFVIFGPTTNSKMGNPLLGRQGRAMGMLGGKPIDLEDYRSADREVELNYFLANGTWPDERSARRTGFNLQRETYFRLLQIQKQKDFNIQVSPEAIAALGREILGPASLTDLVEKGLKPRGFGVEDFERYLRHQVGLEQLIMVAGLGGALVTPQEGEELYRKEHQDLSVSVVFFPASNYLSGITVTPAELTNYYSKAMANYTIPVRRQVEYVRWDITNYLADAKSELGTNLEHVVEENYRQGTNFYKNAKTADEAKSKLREDVIHAKAISNARRAAGTFAEALDNVKPQTAATFEAFAKDKKMTVETTAPFDQENGPAGMDVLPGFTQAAFSRTIDEPFSGALEGTNAVYVLALRNKLESQVPPLKEVEAKATADYKMSQALQMARTSGAAFALTATNSLAQGKTFAALATEAKVKAEALPPFSLSTRELPAEVEQRINLSMLKQVAFMTSPGKTSQFIPTQDGGFVVYLQAKLPVDETKLKQELPNFLASVRMARQNDAVNQWFQAQMQEDPGFVQTVQQALEGTSVQSKGKPKS